VIVKVPHHGEVVLDTGLTYDGVTPIFVRVTNRHGRYRFSDDGGAVSAATVDVDELVFPDRLWLGENEVNVSRRGVVWLPAFARQGQEWLEQVVSLVAEGSLVLYESLLEPLG